MDPLIVGTTLQISGFRAVLRCQRQVSLGNPSILAVATVEI